MKTSILKVVSQGDVIYVPSSKEANGQLAKCVLRLKSLSGGKFGDEFACALFGNAALCRLYEGDVLAASLQFRVHEVGGQLYQDVTCNDFVKLNS